MKKFTILSLLLSVLVICGCHRVSECVWEKDRTARPPMEYCTDTLSVHELLDNYFDLAEGDTVTVTGYFDTVLAKENVRCVTPPSTEWSYMTWIYDSPQMSFSKEFYNYEELNDEILTVAITDSLSESDMAKLSRAKCTLRCTMKFRQSKVGDICYENCFIWQIDSIHIEQERP